jgi:hypothetical protein
LITPNVEDKCLKIGKGKPHSVHVINNTCKITFHEVSAQWSEFGLVTSRDKVQIPLEAVGKWISLPL